MYPIMRKDKRPAYNRLRQERKWENGENCRRFDSPPPRAGEEEKIAKKGNRDGTIHSRSDAISSRGLIWIEIRPLLGRIGNFGQ